MKQTLLLFVAGVTLALLAVGGYMAARAFFVSADSEVIPEDIVIERSSPTSARVTFTTAVPVIASIECSPDPEGPFSLCSAETQQVTDHDLKTSIILDPEIEYYFFIKIRNNTFDNLGDPFQIPLHTVDAESFPETLFGLCSDDAGFDDTYDVNKDGCIRQNDRLLLLSQ